jgi:hypothetical protein
MSPLQTFQYGDICFSAVPPAAPPGAVTRESSNRGLPAVSQPRAPLPAPGAYLLL